MVRFAAGAAHHHSIIIILGHTRSFITPADAAAAATPIIGAALVKPITPTTDNNLNYERSEVIIITSGGAKQRWEIILRLNFVGVVTF